MYKYALIGLGGLGKLHLKNLLKIEQERKDVCLKAICGADKKTFQDAVNINLGNVDVSSVDFMKYNFYDNVQEMLESENLDFVISTLPSFLHCETAVYCLEHGVHVLSEKPMALSAEQCEKMVQAADENGKLLMIGHCLRFAGVYEKLKEYIEQNIFGRVRRVECTRNSPMPTWTFNNWILDYDKSGGCVLDMHIHDVDLINWFFGLPQEVNSFATHDKLKFESIFTTYHYGDMLVTASADWSFPQKFPFESKFLIQFENAYVEVINNQLKIYTDDEILTPEIDMEDYFIKEMREFVKCVVIGKKSDIISAESAIQSVKIALAEIESAEKGVVVNV